MRIAVASLALLALSGTAFAQDWPARPVTMIVPYAAGGPVDTVGRIMAQGLSEALGQQVIIENIGGAGGMTGANRVAKASPASSRRRWKPPTRSSTTAASRCLSSPAAPRSRGRR